MITQSIGRSCGTLSIAGALIASLRDRGLFCKMPMLCTTQNHTEARTFVCEIKKGWSVIGRDVDEGGCSESIEVTRLGATSDGTCEPTACSKKLKILFHHRTASKDGQAVHIEELVSAFRRRGHEVVIVGPRFWEGQDFGGERRFVRFLKTYLPQAAFEILELAYSLVAYRRLAKACDQLQPDLLYERFNLFLLAGDWIKRRRGVPYFLEVNAPLFDERNRYSGIALKRFAHFMQKKAWQSADKALPVTNVLADYLRRDGVPEQRISVIHNGINPAQFLRGSGDGAAKARFGFEDAVVLGFTGFIHEWHGLASIIDLLAEVRGELNLKLLIVGEGPERINLERQAAGLGVSDSVHFEGLVERPAIPDVVSAFDVALQPAATAYASPLKLFEYMALGRAIVAPAQPNIEEIVVDGETALLFVPNDFDSMCARVRELCSDAALRKRLGDAARRAIIEQEQTWDGNAKRIEDLYFDFCDSRRDGTGS